jgi:hypothetical protein
VNRAALGMNSARDEGGELLAGIGANPDGYMDTIEIAASTLCTQMHLARRHFVQQR